ncbi:MAG TPA: nucleotide disphospho-sugar-binding domain-containing protein [Tepidisphaeraceae bacterium]|jgi:UDP:flavonoid glycosyltransferase YjiC (YdhE family)|nr:nucleotide disphospho-sugar-binding domain-containing protein [Tepidisphaeraceae bacterium]
MHAIFASLGTDGDIFPYLALGVVLRRRGHRVTAVFSEEYRSRTVGLGLEFRALVSAEENRELFDNPDFWHPLKGGKIGADWGVSKIPATHATLMELVSQGDAVLIVNPAILAARVIQDHLGTPTATMVLQPWMLPSIEVPPIMPAGLTMPAWAPWPMKWLYFQMLETVGYVLLGRQLNAFRAALGLPRVWRVFKWWLSPELVIGMFPEWFGKPEKDWPPHTTLAGFSRFDGQENAELSADVAAFCKAGAAPLVVTAGTGMMHAAGLFHAAADACRRLGMRAIFLTRHTSQLPNPLPPTILQAAYAPFSRLFPLCAAVVHHGGVGTAAAALAAGVPQLVLPQAFDQFDNAVRLKRLGVARYLSVRNRRGILMARELRFLLRAGVKARCATLATKAAGGSGLEIAANLVERLVQQRIA